MTQLLMKSNFLIALEKCVRDFTEFIEKTTNIDRPLSSVLKAEECREAFLTCIDACESAEVNTRGQRMYAGKVLCSEFLKNCIVENDPLSLKCAESCKLYILECEYLLAD